MSRRIQILIIEDSEDDALLMIENLRQNEFDPVYERVETEKDTRAALAKQSWDIVIADYNLPRFNGRKALDILRENDPDTPFILVSGTVPIATAVEIMRAGAQDFVFKDNLARLVPAATRELREAEVRREQKRAEEELQRSEEYLRMIFENAPVPMITYDETATILRANSACKDVYGFDPEQLVGRKIYETIGQYNSKEKILERTAFVFSGGEVKNVEWQDRRADGTSVWVLTNITPVCDPHGRVIAALSTSVDITDRQLSQEREREMAEHRIEFYRRTIMAFTGGKLIISSPKEIIQMAGEPIALWEVKSLADISMTRELVYRKSTEAGMDDPRAYDFVSCAIEAATNAYKHAGGGLVSLHLLKDSMMLVVSDMGPGIEALALPDVALTRGYTTTGTLGMGYKVMIAFADRIYLATEPGKTIVAVEMSLHAAEQKAALEPGANIPSLR